MINNGYSKEFLKDLESMEVKEKYVKLELLNWNEEVIKEIQGLITQGSMTYDGKSSMRRTCSFTFILPNNLDSYELEEIIGLNKKFKLYIGYKNRLSQYKEYGDIIWFKMGVYVFISANFTHSTSACTVAVTARDKMCLLNGSVQGTIPDTVILHETSEYEPVIIYDIIQELVNHYGQEPLQNMFINDIPDHGRLLIKYMGADPIYLERVNGSYTGNYSFGKTSYSDFKEFHAGDTIGYKVVQLTYPGELIAKVGSSIAQALDSICSVLGNFEYFYDVDGHFVFQEKRNYLNTSYIPLTELEDGNYEANFNTSDIIYSFKGTNLISSFSNTPKWDNIKNDFVVWGTRTTSSGAEIPVRYHLAIDDYPQPQDPEDYIDYQNKIPKDYREILYLRDQRNVSTASWYQMEMNTVYNIDGEEITEWRRLYNGTDWTDEVKNDPQSLNYFLDFIDGSGKYSKYSISNIGRRTIAKEDKDATCVYKTDPPEVVWVSIDEKSLLAGDVGKDIDAFTRYKELGYTCSRTNAALDSALVASSEGKSCYDVIREMFYQQVSLQETISLSTIPLYYLEPNDKIEVEDNRSNIYGNYIISSMTIPLAYNGMMTISATRAETRI